MGQSVKMSDQSVTMFHERRETCVLWVILDIVQFDGDGIFIFHQCQVILCLSFEFNVGNEEHTYVLRIFLKIS